MAKTKQLTVSSVTPTAVVATNFCHTIAVGEDPSVVGWPTTDFAVLKPSTTDQERTIPIGNAYHFERRGNWSPGQTVGYIRSLSGTTTFFQDEMGS